MSTEKHRAGITFGTAQVQTCNVMMLPDSMPLGAVAKDRSKSKRWLEIQSPSQRTETSSSLSERTDPMVAAP